MLMPKRVKRRRVQKGRIKGNAQRGTRIDFGDFGIKALEIGRITSRQIEAARISMTRHMKRQGKVWIRIFPDKPVTMKGGEIPMGKGKGSVDHYVCMIKPGTVMFEMDGIDEKSAKEAMNSAAYKLPIKCQFVKK